MKDKGRDMTRHANPRRAKVAQQELYAQLGLPAQASDQDAKTAHKELVRFLQSAPDGIRKWAQREIATVDEAYALLSDPATLTATRRRSRLVRRVAVRVGVLAAAVGIAVGVYNMGNGKSESESQSEPESQKTAAAAQEQNLSSTEQAQVARLMKKIQAHPNDVASLVRLGNIFFRAEDYKAAGGWMAKAVDIEPRNVTARLALGAAQFNLGGAADARRQWLRVIEIDPKNVEAYYDLGFLYLSKKPPDMASARKVWRKVVEIAPDSAAAKTVADHLKRLKSSRAPSGSASPAAPQLGSRK